MVVNSLSNEWVTFSTDGGVSSGFEAIVPPSTALARRSSHSKKRGESARMASKNKTDAATVATWMKQPINSDASWAPVAPPAEHPTANKKRPPRTRTGSMNLDQVETSSSRQNRQNLNGPNPVSSDSSSSSTKQVRSKSKSRGISVDRSMNRSRSLQGQKVATSTQTISLASENVNIINRNRASQDFREGESDSSGGNRSRLKVREKSKERAKSKGSQHSNSAQVVDANNISMSSDHVRSSQNELLRVSTRDSRQGRETNSRRGRSLTRNPDEIAKPHHHVSDSLPVLQPPPQGLSSRGRSSSRTRLSTRERSSSATRRTNVTTATGTMQRSGSRPPATNITRRSRSTSRTPVTRARSMSRTRTTKPPPSTSRTRREMRTATGATSNSVSGGSNRRGSNRSMTSMDDNSYRSIDPNIGRDISFGRTQSSSSKPLTPKRSVFMEKLFGDQVSDEAKQAYLPRADPSPTNGSVSSVVSWQQPERIHSRILLTATVYHNTATNLWIATINTNQKGVAKNPATASKYLKAFSFSSEKEARESAIANAPPKMMKFEDNPYCFICRGKFAMFRRACHCRNCGVCVCNACATTWPAKMIPETYNLKKESSVKICKSCNFLSGAFKKALLDGDYEEAVALYGSGNINLRTPFPQFSKRKEELMYPIHSAVEGGNIDIVRWLMEDHFCPVKVIRTASGKRPKKGGSPDFPILTSRNRSVLSIAMESLHVEILRYLVVDNNVSIYESKDLKASLRALEAVLLALPGGLREYQGDDFVHRWDDAVFDGETSVTSSLGADLTIPDDDGMSKSKRHNSDACIICYDNAIDCVITPCGHQICCLECSRNLSACPVCNMRGDFIKIFRP